MRKAALAAALALWAACGGGLAAAQDLSPAQMRALGFELLQVGDPARALAVAEALIGRDGQDSVALILRARALRDLGRDDEARAAARLAWKAAPAEGSERFGAALTMAQALSSSGRRGQAQLWLRRAAEAAPDPQARAVAMRDFRYVRSRNPLRLSFGFGIAPSSNVNNGSQHSDIEGFGLSGTLSPDAQALSGWAATASLSARYRLAETPGHSTWARLSFTRREVRLSQEARAAIEAWRSAQAALGNTVTPRTDFDFAAVEAGLVHNRRGQKGVLSFGLTAGHNWFGGQDMSDYLKLDLSGERGLGDGQAIFASVSAERQWRLDAPNRDADLLTLTGGFARRLASGDRLIASLGGRTVASAAPDVRHEALIARLNWEKAEPVAGVRVEAQLSAERRRYGRSFLAPAGRRDLRLDAEVTLTFERFDYMGFAPTLDLRASRFRSNIKVHDGKDVGISLGFRSVF